MPKNIVICCDGTGNEFGPKNTNVVKLFELLVKNPATQVAYYDPGVGTLSAPGAISAPVKWFTKLLGLAFAFGLTGNIEDAYRYLMERFNEGDRVYLFGFSRGAFTVRALAGMIYKCGLLQRGSENLIPYASKMYRHGSKKLAEGFKRAFSRECPVHFIGVWDTVKSVGLFRQRRFPNSVLNPSVAHARQALSLDEQRSHFRPSLWDHTPGQDICQVWFAGVHSDVGGGYAAAGLSHVALHWLAKQAYDEGLLIDRAGLATYHPDPEGRMHNSLLPIWWILGWWRRFVPDRALVHESVRTRMGSKPEYRPKNLLAAQNVTYVP
jgi:uncharacterized protein (DUF2235 family)